MRLLPASPLIVALLLIATAARADTYGFVLTSPQLGTETFQIRPDDFLTGADQVDGFALQEIPSVVNGSSVEGDIGFQSTGGMSYDFQYLPFAATSTGPVLYTGTPVFGPGPDAGVEFNTGSFTIYEYDPYAEATDTVTVQITDLTSTPEPSSVLLLGTGLLGVAGAARRRFFVRR